MTYRGLRTNAHLDDDDDYAANTFAATPLRSPSPLVIEEDEGLTSFFQREADDLNMASHSGAAANDPILTRDQHHEDGYGLLASPSASKTATHPVELTSFIALLTFTACISGLLFGYDTGVISSTLVSIGTDLDGSELSTLSQSLITSSTSLFALIASPLAGWLADKHGRCWVILAADALFILGALVQSFSRSVVLMVLGRSVVGAAVGAASLVTPLYISELAPPAYRGRLVVVNNIFLTGGQMLAYVLGWKLASVPHGWRWMVGLGAVPAVFQLAMLTFMPETPRWLVRVGRKEPARAVLNRAYGAGAESTVDALIRMIEREVLEEEEARHQRVQTSNRRKKSSESMGDWRPDGWAELFEVAGHRRALVIACLLQGLQQLCGFNSLMYFSATIFRRVGFSNPILAALSVAITNFVFTLVAMLLIDRIGRRRILLLTVPFMSLSLLVTSLAFRSLSDVYTSGPDVPYRSDGGSTFWPSVVLVSIIAYVAFYAMGIGTVPWQQSELFPLSVRSLGCGLATATNWGSNFVIGLTFLPMMQLLTPTFTFMLYAIICVLGSFAVYAVYPETKGLGLEDVGALLRDGWGVGQISR